MANNENINKVVYGNETLIDLTQDSVTPQTLLEGETAHDRSGASIEGTAKQGHVIQNNSGTDLTQRSKLQFKGLNVTDDATSGKTVVENNNGNAIGFEETVGTACKNPNGYTVGSYFKGTDGNFYEVTAAISSGATITVGTNCKKTDIATELIELNACKLGDFTKISDVTISGVKYHTYWEVAPTTSNQVYGVAVHPTNGKLTRIYNNKGTYTAVSYDANTTTGDGIKTKVAKTGTAQSAIASTISASTTLDNAIGTLLNNDATLNADLSEKLDASKLTFGSAFTHSQEYLNLYWNDSGSVLGFEVRLNANTLLRVQFSSVNVGYFYSNDNGATWNTFWNK